MDGAVPNRDTEGANRRDYSLKPTRAAESDEVEEEDVDFAIEFSDH